MCKVQHNATKLVAFVICDTKEFENRLRTNLNPIFFDLWWHKRPNNVKYKLSYNLTQLPLSLLKILFIRMHLSLLCSSAPKTKWSISNGTKCTVARRNWCSVYANLFICLYANLSADQFHERQLLTHEWPPLYFLPLGQARQCILVCYEALKTNR